jgi:predicted nucleic acid-binding protein
MLVDANVIMYAAGAEHAHKRPSVALLERVATSRS